MLVAKTFKADLDNQKGHLQASDLGALFAFTYPQKAGILNITGTDCSYNGYPAIVGNTAQLTFNKGYIVIFGRAIYIEQNTQVAFNMPTSGSVNGVLGVKINLAENGANEVSWFQKTTTPQTDNLLSKDANGVYEFVLYSYSATPSTFVVGEKTSEIINQDWLTKYATIDYVNNQIGIKEITLTTGSMIFNTTAYDGMTLTGIGSITYDVATGKKYWRGDLVGTREPSGTTIPEIEKLELLYLSFNGANVVKVVSGGILSYSDLQIEFAGIMTDFERLGQRDKVSYISNFVTKPTSGGLGYARAITRFACGRTNKVAITNMVLEVE